MQRVIIGNELKFNVHIDEIDGMHMSDYNFEVEFIKTGYPRKSVLLKSSDGTLVDQDNYIFCFDTSNLGAGKIKCKITAHIPDTYFSDDSHRTEVVEIDTGIELVKSS